MRESPTTVSSASSMLAAITCLPTTIPPTSTWAPSTRMGGTWTERAYAATEPLWAQIYAHPFLTELAAGTLPDDKLIFYFEQNVHYIDTVVRCRAVAVAKSTSPEVRDFFLGPIPVFVDEL